MEQRIVALILIVAFASGEASSWPQYEAALHRIQANTTLLQAWNKNVDYLLKSQTRTKAAFPCEISKSEVPPQTVDELRPGDIGVVAAMGDSITAGNGINALTPIGCLTHYRGYSWSVGGVKSYEDNVITLPNMLKKHNPSVYGYSTGTGGQNSRHAKMNVADAGNVASDMPVQARLLVERMQGDINLSFLNDWKLVTLFIGGNDLCDYCKDESRYSVENYVKHIQQALDYLHANLPRTFVNVVAIFDITPVAGLSDGLICDIIHWAVCDCGANDKYKDIVKAKAREYADAVEKLISSGRYDNDKQFTVVYQPFMRDNQPPKKPDGSIDLGYFAPDCFHFSRKGHSATAKMLYSAMFEPVGQKKTCNDFEDVEITCPNKDAFLATTKNSLTKVTNRALDINPIMSESRPGNSNSAAVSLGIIVGVLSVMLVVCFVGLVYYKRKQDRVVPLIA